MAKATSPAPAKSGQAKTRGTTKAKATEAAKPDEIVAGAAPTAAAPVDPAATVAGSTQIQDGAPTGSTSTENTLQDGTLPLPGAGGDGADSLGDDAGDGAGDDVGETSGTSSTEPPADPSVLAGGDGTGDGAGDAPDLDDAKPDGEESPLPALSARLFNHSNQTHRIVKARLTLPPGESSVVEFRDDKHREQCEKHVSQIRSLNRWGEGEGLHWGAAE